MIATTSQAWTILVRYAQDEIQSLRLQESCQDNHHVSLPWLLVQDHSNHDSTLFVDFPRQVMTYDTRGS